MFVMSSVIGRKTDFGAEGILSQVDVDRSRQGKHRLSTGLRLVVTASERGSIE